MASWYSSVSCLSGAHPGPPGSDPSPRRPRGSGGTSLAGASGGCAASATQAFSARADEVGSDGHSLPIMTYEESVITGGSHALTQFYPHRPAGPPLRRRDPSGPPETPGSRTQVPG